jgi:hypothetical protein
MGTALSAILFLLCASGGHALTGEDSVTICARNPHYWQYRGEPVLLLGGSVEDNLFQVPDLVGELDTLAACGGNYVRCTMSSRDEGNVWPFAIVDGLYDLDHWNEEYWRRFETFLDQTEARDILVQVEVWATFDFYRDNWDPNPFNPKNNRNYAAEETGLPVEVPTHPTKAENDFFRSVPAELNQTTVLRYQRRFVDRMLAAALQHGNVLYCMDNETSVTPEWGRYWAHYVRAAAETRGRTVHVTEMWDPWDLSHEMHRATFDHPETYTFCDISQNNHNSGQVHYDGAVAARRRAADPVRPVNCVKTYGADGGRFGTTDDGIDRFWRNVFAGVAAVRFHRPPSGIGLSDTAQRMIKSAREVTDAVDLFACEPRPDLLSDRDDDAAYCLANPGREYLVYFPRAGEATLDLSAADRDKTLRWYDVEAGRWAGDEAVPVAGPLRLQAPANGRWAAAIR